jgi:hypothetical protein
MSLSLSLTLYRRQRDERATERRGPVSRFSITVVRRELCNQSRFPLSSHYYFRFLYEIKLNESRMIVEGTVIGNYADTELCYARPARKAIAVPCHHSYDFHITHTRQDNRLGSL